MGTKRIDHRPLVWRCGPVDFMANEIEGRDHQIPARKPDRNDVAELHSPFSGEFRYGSNASRPSRHRNSFGTRTIIGNSPGIGTCSVGRGIGHSQDCQSVAGQCGPLPEPAQVICHKRVSHTGVPQCEQARTSRPLGMRAKIIDQEVKARLTEQMSASDQGVTGVVVIVRTMGAEISRRECSPA